MKIKVLGPGCPKCEQLNREVINSLAELGLAADVEKVSDMNEIMKYDVMLTPALVINDKVKVSGRVPKREDIKKMIRDEQE